MTPFTFSQLQRIAEIYRQYIGVRYVRLVLGVHPTRKGSLGTAYINRHQILINPKVLTISRRAQLGLIIHEICHFKTPHAMHSKRWQNNAYLWGSKFQMRYVVTDIGLRANIEGKRDSYTPEEWYALTTGHIPPVGWGERVKMIVETAEEIQTAEGNA